VNINDLWIIEYSYFFDAFGVKKLTEYIGNARQKYISHSQHPYVILGAYASEQECRDECAILQKQRNEHPLTVEERFKEFQEAADGLKKQLH